MNKNSGNLWKGMMSGLLLVAILLTMIPICPDLAMAATSDTTLTNPRVVAIDNNSYLKMTTWDCVWFGSYPQREVVGNVSQCGIYGKPYYKSDDVIVDGALYSQLQEASYDANGDTVIDGSKYKRVSNLDATYVRRDAAAYYSWNSGYHYFRYDPVKWRVLNTDGKKAILVADQVLDDRRYHDEDVPITWEDCTMRAWLNEGFFSSAFNQEEQSAVVLTKTYNDDNFVLNTEGGNHTQDLVFLLSESDVDYTDEDSMALEYGYRHYDNQCAPSRYAKSTTYAMCMGVMSSCIEEYIGNCSWWIRTPGQGNFSAILVESSGLVDYYGEVCNSGYYGTRPAVVLDLSSTEVWDYAGTVDSDGVVAEHVPSGHVHDHSDVRKTNLIPSTCTERGAYDLETYCAKCGTFITSHHYTEPALGHAFMEGRCSRCGYDYVTDPCSALSAPRISEDKNMQADQVTTWDCVWFGEYPQREVVADSRQCGTYGKYSHSEKDYILDADLYQKLEQASYDDKGRTYVEGKRYVRLAYADTTAYGIKIYEEYYKWDDSYHYFAYEPIKWRVLSTDGSKALLLSDRALDDQQYHATKTAITWENSSIRNWLNTTFMEDACSSLERSAITLTNVSNHGNSEYGVTGGNDTKDRIFLLSEADVYRTDSKSQATSYGFVTKGDIKDEGRRSKASPYALAMGTHLDYSTSDNCGWWLRSPGRYDYYASFVYHTGKVDYYGYSANNKTRGVRPALTLNLSNIDKWNYAGTVSSDGSMDEVGFSAIDSRVQTIARGYSGDLTWELMNDGTMYMKGSGNMRTYDCFNDTPWYQYREMITNVIFEDGVVKITPYAFKNCTILSGVKLPHTLKTLGEGTFYGCSSLKSIEIPEGIYTVWEYCFKNCTALESVSLPKSLIKLGEAAFYGCSALTRIEIPDNCSIVGAYCFKNCTKLADVKLPATMENIREAAFYATAVPSLDVPSKVTKVGPYAFKNCTELTAISLPESLTLIDEAAFYGCEKLESVDIPDAVTAIGNYAFRRCTGLNSVEFPAGLKTVGECSFYGCTGLSELEIPEGTSVIKPYAFKACSSLVSIALPDTLTTLGESALNSCTSLAEITIPASVTAIEDYCFSGDTLLKNVTFEGSAPAIGTGAFKNVVAKVFYPSGDASWTSEVMMNYGGNLTWNAK